MPSCIVSDADIGSPGEHFFPATCEREGVRSRIMYVELKTGYNDNGPAWIGRVSFVRAEYERLVGRPK